MAGREPRAEIHPRWPPEAAERISAPTRTLHETLIRLAKGMILAWEKWLNER
jgi:hypothetical protein